MQQAIKFIDRNRSPFFATVRRRVDAYFAETGKPKQADGRMIAKVAFFLSALVALYFLILLGGFSASIMLGFAIALGVVCALIGFNVCHDAIHGSFSTNPTVNRALSLVFNLIGANAYVWGLTHNVIHHTYTNIPGHDEDLEVAPGLVRLSPDLPLKPIHRFQHYYSFLLYGLASISWVFRKDYLKFFKTESLRADGQPHPRSELYTLIGFKVIYYTLFIVVPLLVLPITIGQFAIGFLVMHLAEGLTLGLVFQLAHVVEGTDFPYPTEEGTIEEAWAVHQMQTTANFGRKDWLTTFLCGGLNMQVEHHLFPKISHIHYPAISDIVKQTADEFGVPYIENTSFWTALASHYRMLKKLGKSETIEVGQLAVV